MHTKHWTQDTAQCQLVEGQVPSVAEHLGLRGMKLARKESSPGTGIKCSKLWNGEAQSQQQEQ